MAFGIYVHIPYCIQRCRYCDFTTFEQHSIMPPKDYVDLVKKEIRQRHQQAPSHQLDSLYFGGGTPSLLSAELIVSIIDELANMDFRLKENVEITIEINPATVSEKKLTAYLKAGINRFSVGAQTFSSELLQACGREHTAKDTIKTLELLKSYNLNFSFDLLFALPGQTKEQVKQDIDLAIELGSSHLSAYCLTVPQNHPMAKGRAPESEQIEMFNIIENRLALYSFSKYEISNFAKPGLEAKHNMLYWTDHSYWGLGLSAHSYFNKPDFGTRFWNPRSFELYKEQLASGISSDQREKLKLHEAMTDFCHMFLRTAKGLSLASLKLKFPGSWQILSLRLEKLTKNQLVRFNCGRWHLTPSGQMLSNQVFSELTVMPSDIDV